MANHKKLYRSNNNRIVAGIAGGLADYFEWDSTVVRLVFLVVLFAGGLPMLVLYLAAMLFIPNESEGVLASHHVDDKEKQWLAKRRSIVKALAVLIVVAVLVGIVFFAGGLAGAIFSGWSSLGWHRWNPAPTNY